MRNIFILLSAILFLSSCAEETNSEHITALSVKKDVIEAFKNTEWVPTGSSTAYYSKIVFDGDIIELTRGGSAKRVGFDVTNIFGPMQTLPETIQLRLKSGLYLDEIYIKRDYTSFKSVVRSDVESTFTGDSEYKRIK